MISMETMKNICRGGRLLPRGTLWLVALAAFPVAAARAEMTGGVPLAMPVITPTPHWHSQWHTVAMTGGETPVSRVALAPADDQTIPEVGYGIEPLDAVVLDTLKKFGIPGGALAVAKDGKLVVAKGYGWANIGAHQPVTPDSPFCLASVTKAITGVAMMRLVQEGKVALSDRIYTLLGSPKPLDNLQLDARVKEITLRQLLLHAGGFDAKKSGDYMHMAKKIAKQTGQKLPLSDELLIRYAFSRPLGYAPGTEEQYSNFGFFLCKEVIQRVSRQPYEQYVREHVLRPAGITGMELERRKPHYATGEAHRYGPDGLKEFAGGSEPIDGPAGSWIASAVDMARFLTAVDGSRGKSLLSPAIYREMLSPPPRPLKARSNGTHFRLGWISCCR